MGVTHAPPDCCLGEHRSTKCDNLWTRIDRFRVMFVDVVPQRRFWGYGVEQWLPHHLGWSQTASLLNIPLCYNPMSEGHPGR